MARSVRAGDRDEPLVPTRWLHDRFSVGFLLGLLVGEGHFGGDGRQAQVTLRMHTRHKPIFDWIMATFPGGRLYGPYVHGGRRYYQWMARGRFLADELVPLIGAHLPLLDGHVAERFRRMCERYGLALEPYGEPVSDSHSDTPTSGQTSAT